MAAKKCLSEEEKELFKKAYKKQVRDTMSETLFLEKAEKAMKNYCSVLEIGNYIFVISKPKIEKSFLFEHDMFPNIEWGNRVSYTSAENSALFIGANIVSSEIYRSLQIIQKVREGQGTISLWNRFHMDAPIVDYFRYSTNSNAKGDNSTGVDYIHYVTDDELDKLEQEFWESLDMFVERMNKYVKRYNTDIIYSINGKKR